MDYLKYIMAEIRENPIDVYVLVALVLAFVLVAGAVISTL